MEAVAAGGRAVEEGVVARGRDAVGRGSGSAATPRPEGLPVQRPTKWRRTAAEGRPWVGSGAIWMPSAGQSRHEPEVMSRSLLWPMMSRSVTFTVPPDCTQMPADGTRGRSPTIVAWSMSSSSLLLARPGSFVAGTPTPASVIVPRRTRQVAPVAIRTPTIGASAVKSMIELPPDLARRSTNAPAVPSTRASRPMSAKRTAWLPTPASSTTKTSAVG